MAVWLVDSFTHVIWFGCLICCCNADGSGHLALVSVLDCMTASYIQVDLLKMILKCNHDGHALGLEHTTYADSRPRSETVASANAGFFVQIVLYGYSYSRAI